MSVNDGGAGEVSAVFVAYEETPGGEGVFVYLPTTAAAVVAVETRNPKAAHVTRIQKISKAAGQPVVDILCFSLGKITPERSREIGQSAVDWLLEEGRLRWNELTHISLLPGFLTFNVGKCRKTMSGFWLRKVKTRHFSRTLESLFEIKFSLRCRKCRKCRVF